MAPDQPVLHVAYLPGSAGWLLPVITRLRSSQHPTLKERAATWGGSELAERGLVLSTKLAMLTPVLRQFDILLQQLNDEIAIINDLDEHLERGAGFMLNNRDLPYAIIVALDTFVFEYRSTYEILGAFLRRFGEQILGRTYTEPRLQGVLTAAGLDVAWAERLARLRKRLFHEAAPWLAIRLLGRDPLRWELLVLDSTAHAKHVTVPAVEFADLRAIHTGMQAALARLHDWLFEEIESFEATAAA